jgi:outer membrane protein assembly factor BamB
MITYAPMRFALALTGAVALLAGAAAIGHDIGARSSAVADEAYWPQWRGPDGTGVARTTAPVRWSDTEGVAWQVRIPGRGHSTPVVWGDRLFVTTAVPSGNAQAEAPGAPAGAARRGPGGGAGPLVEHQFDVLAFDRLTGRQLWRRTATRATPHEGYHRMYGSFASNSPVTDGRRVYASFGSRGVYAFDLEGRPVWQKDFGVRMRMHLQFGEGTAPVLHEDRLLLNFDHEGDSFLVALEASSGRELWRTARDEGSSWAAPLVATHEGRRQVIVSATRKVRSYDLETGRLIWETAGLGTNVIPAPVRYGDLVFAMSGHRNPNLMAIRLGGRGNLTGTEAIVWNHTRGTAYTASPVLHDGRLYVLSDSGMMSCYDARTGTPHYQQVRLPRPYNFKASPLAAGGHLYLASEEGDVIVLKLGGGIEVVATNTFAGQTFIASPVVADGDLYLRSQQYLYRITGS